MDRMRNLYEVLGISPDASNDQVRAAYRTKVKEVHPDAGGSNQAFSEVVIAYEILIDEDRRKQFDDTGSVEDSSMAILHGAKLIIERLLNELIQRDDAKYVDVVALMCTNISRTVSEKDRSIDALEKRRHSMADLKGRFKAKLSSETYLPELLETKIEAVGKAIAAERLSIAQLNAASSLLRRYDFEREQRATAGPTGHIDIAAFGRPFDPLLDTAEFFSERKKQ
jgi:curved DNA-binding protein CbpA